MRPAQIVEAALFASQSPLTPRDIARADESLTVEIVKDALGELRDEYERSDRSFQIYNLGDGYQILTRPEYAPYLERFDSVPRTYGLSPAALETLAIIAYRQPISRVEIEDIRGVGSTTVLRTLQEWELVDITGRGEGLGRPLLYGTTRRLLDHFGLRDLADLPRLEDLPVTLQAERTLEVPPDAQMTGAEEEAVVAAEAEVEVATETPTEDEAGEAGEKAEAAAPPEADAETPMSIDADAVEADAETPRLAEESSVPEDEAGEPDDAAQPDTQEPATV
jgi:segregation and condensation protein B